MQRRSRGTSPCEDPTPAWTRIRTPSPEIYYRSHWSHGDGLPAQLLRSQHRMLSQQEIDNQHQLLQQQWNILFAPETPLASTLQARGSTPESAEEHETGSDEAAKDWDEKRCTDTAGADDKRLGNGAKGRSLTPLARGGVALPLDDDNQPEDSVATPRLGPMAAVESIAAPSRGSVGHPDLCAAPCKYVRKKRGCKDGADCTHCHLCVWHSHRTRFPRAARD
mmetsp:Transcript_35692/g.80654  ORF Transcript_35692/g.80654 Transcript_35692/m.80654 type:complete len:222 (+) Transcript_35692:37-702(+)